MIGLFTFLWLLLVTFTQGWNQLQRLRENPGHSGLLAHGCSGFYGGNGWATGLVDTVWYRPQISTRLVVVYGAGSQLLHGYAGVDEEVAEVSLAQQFESITT